MTPFASAHATGSDTDAIIAECLDGLSGRTEGHDLGLVYVTDEMAGALPRLRAALQEETGIETWVGAVGVGICAGATEHWLQPAASVLTGRIGEGQVLPFATDGPMLDGVSGPLDAWRDAHGPLFALVHADPRADALPETLVSLSEWMPDGFLAGGLVSARAEEGLRVEPACATGGLSGALFAGDVPVLTRHTQGCTPIGARHRITECDDNVLVTLDDRPALEVFREDIGELLARDLSRLGGHVFAGLPVARVDTGDYLVRPLVGIDEARGLLAIAAPVEVGDEVLFCRRDADSARRDLERMLDDVQRLLGERRPRGGVYVSCVARGPSLFGAPSVETALVRERFANLPLTGFFANGEISHDRLYTYTGVLTLFL